MLGACSRPAVRHVRAGRVRRLGVVGGSLLLIPMACSLFGISNDIAMQVVGVGFIIGVIQDSVETALNSAGDVEFAATAEYHLVGSRRANLSRHLWVESKRYIK